MLVFFNAWWVVTEIFKSVLTVFGEIGGGVFGGSWRVSALFPPLKIVVYPQVFYLMFFGGWVKFTLCGMPV